MPPPLTGLRVIEFTHMVAGPACGQVLADLGAEVVKIEPPQGDVTRRIGPLVGAEGGDGGGALSALYASTNRGKRAVCLDLQNADDAKRAQALALQADVVITNVDRRMLERAGVDAPALRAKNGRLIFVEITGFGPGGPPGTDGLAQAATGLMACTGAKDGPGWRTGASVVDVSTGVWSALAVLAALRTRDQTGRGDHVQVSLADVALYMQYTHVVMHDAAPELVRRNGNHSMVSCTPVFECSDGRIIVTVLHARHWRALCDCIGETSLAEDPGYATDPARCERQGDIEARLTPRFRTQSRAHWVATLRRAGVPCGPERDYAEVVRDPELTARGMLFRLPVGGGDVLQVRMPVEFETTERAPARAAPLTVAPAEDGG